MMTAQNRNAEVAVVRDKKPVGFGLWYVKSLPYIGLTCCDYVYSHNRKRGIFELLVKRYIEFGKEQRCPWYECTAINETNSQIIEHMATKLGLNVKRMEFTTMFGWTDGSKV